MSAIVAKATVATTVTLTLSGLPGPQFFEIGLTLDEARALSAELNKALAITPPGTFVVTEVKK